MNLMHTIKIKTPRTKPNRFPVKIKYQRKNKCNTKYPIWRLPYWKRGNTASFPDLDGYGTGCDMGVAAAIAYLKVMRLDGWHGSTLQNFVMDLIEQKPDVSFTGNKGMRGIVVGFFSELDKWLSYAACTAGCGLDEITEEELELRMSQAASETEKEYMERCFPDLEDDDSQAA